MRSMFGEDRKAKLEWYEGCKYTAKCEEDLGKIVETNYTGLKYWTILDGEDGEALVAEGMERDEVGEYLELTFMDGTTATFRNSHCDLFVL